MVINPTYLAQRTRSCVFRIRTQCWNCTLIAYSGELARRPAEGHPCLPTMVKISEYTHGTEKRLCIPLTSLLRQAPEVQQMYSLNMPVSKIRTKVRQEFERHRYVNKLSVVDMLLFQHHAEFQVCCVVPGVYNAFPEIGGEKEHVERYLE